MKLIKHIILLKIIFCLIFLVSCHRKSNRYISANAYKLILTKFPQLKNNELTVYYMDGGCSFCIEKAMAIDKDVKKIKNMKAVFVAVNDNPVLVEYYFNKNKIDGLLISGKDSILRNSNIRFNEVVEIHTDKSILTVNKYN